MFPPGFFEFAGIIKLFVLTLLIFYFVFTLVVYRQITLMTQILDSQVSPFVKLIALLQIAIVGFLFFLAIVIA